MAIEAVSGIVKQVTSAFEQSADVSDLLIAILAELRVANALQAQALGLDTDEVAELAEAYANEASELKEEG